MTEKLVVQGIFRVRNYVHVLDCLPALCFVYQDSDFLRSVLVNEIFLVLSWMDDCLGLAMSSDG